MDPANEVKDDNDTSITTVLFIYLFFRKGTEELISRLLFAFQLSDGLFLINAPQTSLKSSIDRAKLLLRSA